jgi:hypothetical protein
MLMIRDQLLEHINLLLEVSDLLLIVGWILLASLDNLFNALALHLNSIEVFIGAKEFGFHHLKLRLAFSLCVHLQHNGLIVLF